MNKPFQFLIFCLFALSPLPAFADKDGDLRTAVAKGDLA